MGPWGQVIFAGKIWCVSSLIWHYLLIRPPVLMSYASNWLVCSDFFILYLSVSHDRNTLTRQVHLPRVWPHRLSCICRSGFRHDWQCRFGLAWLCYLVGWCRGFWWAVAWLQVIRWCLNIEIYTKLVIWMGNLIDHHCRFLGYTVYGIPGISCFGITTGSCQLALKICLSMGRTVYQVILWYFMNLYFCWTVHPASKGNEQDNYDILWPSPHIVEIDWFHYVLGLTLEPWRFGGRSMLFFLQRGTGEYSDRVSGYINVPTNMFLLLLQRLHQNFLWLAGPLALDPSTSSPKNELHGLPKACLPLNMPLGFVQTTGLPQDWIFFFFEKCRMNLRYLIFGQTHVARNRCRIHMNSP